MKNDADGYKNDGGYPNVTEEEIIDADRRDLLTTQAILVATGAALSGCGGYELGRIVPADEQASKVPGALLTVAGAVGAAVPGAFSDRRQVLKALLGGAAGLATTSAAYKVTTISDRPEEKKNSPDAKPPTFKGTSKSNEAASPTADSWVARIDTTGETPPFLGKNT